MTDEPLTAAGAPGGHSDAATDVFLAHRNLLFTIAYEILGSAADAEDALQETWMRWAGVDLDDVHNERAYLVTIATHQALSRLRTLGRRRESYVGPWLPEPLLTAPDVADDVELAESVSMAMLLVMETLAPTERAVFVLREVFDLPYDEIAIAVDKTSAAVRQIAHRARAHVAARRPRGTVSPDESRPCKPFSTPSKRVICKSWSTSSHLMWCSSATEAESRRPWCAPSSGPTAWHDSSPAACPESRDRCPPSES